MPHASPSPIDALLIAMITLSPADAMTVIVLVGLVTALGCWAIYAWPSGEAWDDRWARRLSRGDPARSGEPPDRGISVLGRLRVNLAIWLGLWALAAIYVVHALQKEQASGHVPRAVAYLLVIEASIPFVVCGALCCALWMSCMWLRDRTKRPRSRQRLGATDAHMSLPTPRESPSPSSHAALAGFTWLSLAAAFVLFQLFWLAVLPALWVAGGVGVSRIRSGAQRPRAVVAGWALGIGFAVAAWLVWPMIKQAFHGAWVVRW